MSLRGKSFLILFGTTLLASLLAGAIWFAYSRFQVSAYEADLAERAFGNAMSLVDEDLDQLDVTAKDWASWDDSYRYAVTADPAYARSNFASGDTFAGLGLSGFAFVGPSGEVLYAYAERAADEADVEALAESLPRARASLGLALLGRGAQLVAARPVLRSDGSGPARGLIVMARELGAARLVRYGRLVGATARLSALVDGGAEEGEGAGLVEVARAPSGVRAASTLRDINGAALIRLELFLDPRGPSGGISAPALLLLSILLVGGGVGAASILVLESSVFRRIRELESGLGAIASGKDPLARLTERGDDDFSGLARVMNRTLDSLGAVIKQRDATLREANHRVKNNLQVVASLLSLQAADSRSPEAAEALREGKRKVLALAMVHEELYADPDLGSVRADGFLERLALAVEPRTAEGAHVAVIVEGEAVAIDAWRAMNVGIIMSEAMTVAARCAVDSRGARRLLVSALPAEGGGFSIGMRREGPGPEGPVPGLGSAFSRNLAAQIGGTVEVGPAEGEGTFFVLRVPAGQPGQG